MRGVVLCGGESKRMGSDKGLLSIGSDSWSMLAFRKLESLNIPVAVSVNKMQELSYRNLFSPRPLILDQLIARGPLRGLISAHLSFPNDDLLVLACDMTEMDVKTLQHLQQFVDTLPGYDYYVFGSENFIEPLCAVYSSAALKKLYKDLSKGRLLNFSLHKLIRVGNYKTLTITDPKKFTNHNTLNFPQKPPPSAAGITIGPADTKR